MKLRMHCSRKGFVVYSRLWCSLLYRGNHRFYYYQTNAKHQQTSIIKKQPFELGDEPAMKLATYFDNKMKQKTHSKKKTNKMFKEKERKDKFNANNNQVARTIR